jgi:hypothetical protein
MPENAETIEFNPVPPPKREGVKSYEQKKLDKKQEKNMHDNKSNPLSPVSRHFQVEKPCRGFAASSIIFLAIIVIVMGLGSTTLPGQSLAGTWQDSQYNIKMVLKADGTYTLQYPSGYSQGRYSSSQGMFCLQDASGVSPVCYTVVSYTVNMLVLRDLNGMELNYKRSGGAGVTPPVPPRTGTPGNGTGAEAILAQKGGYTLKMAHFNAGLGIVQFIIGQPVKAVEVQELKSKLIQEFQQAPAEVIRQLNSLATSLNTIHSATDPVRIGLARQELFSAFYQATRNFKEKEKPLMIQVINRYIKVLAYDPANRLVLTDKDAESMLKYLAFNSELMGQKIQLSAALRQAVMTDLVNKFAVAAVEQKRLLCSASLIWLLVESNWNKMTPAQKQQFKNTYASQIRQKSTAYAAANANTSTGSTGSTGTGYNPGTAKSAGV